MVKTKAKDLLQEEAKEKGVPATTFKASKTWFSVNTVPSFAERAVLYGKVLVEMVKAQNLDGKKSETVVADRHQHTRLFQLSQMNDPTWTSSYQ
jgi:hypothetical protein